MKIVVFDLDETLGYFTQYGIFWDSLSNYLKIKNKNQLSQTDFDIILELFPEFLRPNIINILTYLKNKKKSNCFKYFLDRSNNNYKQNFPVLKNLSVKADLKYFYPINSNLKLCITSIKVLLLTLKSRSFILQLNNKSFLPI